MSDTAAPQRRSGGGGGWQPRGRGRGYFRNNGNSGRYNGNPSPARAGSSGSLPLLDSQGSQQVITDMLEVSQGPYSGWRLYHKQETEQRKRRSPNWGEAETQLLMRLWSERVQEMKTTKRNGFMLEEMAQLLQANGFARSCTEVKTRIANLSQEYRMEMRKRSLGFPHGNFKLWESVHAILGSEENAAGSFSLTEQQQQHYLNDSWPEQQPASNQGEGAESLCCDIDPGMLMGQHDTGDEGEELEEEEESGEEEDMPLNQLSNHLPPHLNGIPNVPLPPSLTISLTPAPSSTHNTNGNSAPPPPALTRMPALIRVASKRSSRESSPPAMPSLLRQSVGKRPRLSLDSALLPQQLKIEASADEDVKSIKKEEKAIEDNFDGAFSFIAEQIRQANVVAESRANNLNSLMEQQIKLQRQGLKMQKRILTLLESMQPQPDPEPESSTS